jgi:hypothetical protein
MAWATSSSTEAAVRQALLEIYVATVLETPYNDFDDHWPSYSESPASVTK